jgi:glycosyltransferase involved in cell wall biosynthesis
MNNNESTVLSIVIPLFNEEGNVPPLIKALEEAVAGIDKTYEVILVDDGSSDKTWSRIESAAQSNANIKGIKLSRNFGHQHALVAGLAHAKGAAIISMDGDLQHPLSLIKDLLEKWEQGYQVVNTFREDAKVASFFKRITSRYFYKIFSILTDVPMSPGSSDFRLLDRRVLDNLLKFQDVDIFLRGAVNWLGFSTVTIPYQAAKRFSGDSKYSLRKMFQFAKGSLISFSTKPLIIGVWIGVITSFLSFVEIIYIIFQYSQGQTVPGWASTIGVLSFLFGILFIILGIIGTYIARIHMALQARPKFVTSKLVNIED